MPAPPRGKARSCHQIQARFTSSAGLPWRRLRTESSRPQHFRWLLSCDTNVAHLAAAAQGAMPSRLQPTKARQPLPGAPPACRYMCRPPFRTLSEPAQGAPLSPSVRREEAVKLARWMTPTQPPPLATAVHAKECDTAEDRGPTPGDTHRRGSTHPAARFSSAAGRPVTMGRTLPPGQKLRNRGIDGSKGRLG